MSITLDLDPKVEETLELQARRAGLPLADYLGAILEREAKCVEDEDGPTLLQAFDSLRGIVPDEWLNFERDRSPGREVSFE
ncbi:hypothetical protein F183_A04100 [Bryobacterales bacterium F-183]|nr:hypothetical protein F183_A04100 [Bryobacterales bacterium F-183]